MKEYSYSLLLLSDAEPGTGFGSELVNDLIPRDENNNAVLPASHVKGLMRASLTEVSLARNWPVRLVESVFGKIDHKLSNEHSALSLANAATDSRKASRFIVRTAVGENGVASDKSLRTTEAISATTVFKGKLFSRARPGSVEDLAWRLALSCISAVGGNRNRGAGRCVVKIDGEPRRPGQLLKELDTKIGTWNEPKRNAVSLTSKRVLGSQLVVMRLTYRASTPICCPEIPDRSNVISTGFTIPASAVQGALLTYINEVDPALATALFEYAQFRAWPMQPCWQPRPNEPEAIPAAAIRVSLTHKAAKYSVKYGVDDFHDEAIKPRASNQDRTRGAPLKATDGVLLSYVDGQTNQSVVKLWRASDMPLVITSHGVHEDASSNRTRNLFTVVAMAPLVWQGHIVVPKDAVDDIQRIMTDLPQVSIGKSRTVRGLGTLSLDVVQGIPEAWKTKTNNTVLVVQSPIQIPATWLSVQKEFRKVAESWQLGEIREVWASSGILFGWNRLKNGLQQAQRVILPGAVVQFNCKVDDKILYEFLTQADYLQSDERQRGYGAMSVHPGQATELFEFDSTPPPMPKSSQNYAEGIKRVQRIARLNILPSVSQIRRIKDLVDTDGPQRAIDFLKRQMTERTARIWSDWEDCYEEIVDLAQKLPTESLSRALEVLADLTLAKQGDSQ